MRGVGAGLLLYVELALLQSPAKPKVFSRVVCDFRGPDRLYLIEGLARQCTQVSETSLPSSSLTTYLFSRQVFVHRKLRNKYSQEVMRNLGYSSR